MDTLVPLNLHPVTGGGHFAVTAGALNARQTEAVKQGLQRRFSVVQGPPGTGGVFLFAAITLRASRT